MHILSHIDLKSSNNLEQVFMNSSPFIRIMFTHIKADEVKTEDLGALAVQRLLNDPSHESISIVKMQLKGEMRYTSNTVSDFYYFILEGQGFFHFEDTTIKVKEGDVVHIPKNTKYKDEGVLTILGIAMPRFDSKNTVYFD